jgi:large subunit ribosomal protein L23
MDPTQVIIRPVVSEKSFVLAEAGKYTFRVNDRSHKTQIRQAVEQLFDVKVVEVRTASVKSKPKRRGQTAGRTRQWKKAIVQVRKGDTIPIFQAFRGSGVMSYAATVLASKAAFRGARVSLSHADS